MNTESAPPPLLEVAPPKISGMAITSLVLGVLGVVSCGFTALIGLILGIVSLVKIQNSGGKLKGFGIALAGTIISGVFLLMIPIFAAMLLPALAAAHDKAREINCVNNEKQLALAIKIYADDNGNHLPSAATWCDAIKTIAGSEKVFKCPAANSNSRCDYAFNSKLDGKDINQVNPNTVELFESDGGWNADGGPELMIGQSRHARMFVVAFADGSVQQLRQSQLATLRWGPIIGNQTKIMYLIIGGDGKEYGPISAADLRQWISEERLNAQSLVKAESDAEFRKLATFPEFADVIGIAGKVSSAPPLLGSAGGGGREAALQRVKVPAVALMVTAIFNIVLAMWSLIQLIFSRPDLQQLNSELTQLDNPQIEQFVQKMIHLMYGPLGIVNVLFELTISVLIFGGAKKMKSLQSYHFSMAAASLSMVPCLTPCCGYLIGIAFGIWALVILRKPEVKSYFS